MRKRGRQKGLKVIMKQGEKHKLEVRVIKKGLK